MVEIIPKPIERNPWWLTLLLYLSIVACIVAVIGFFVLKNAEKKAEERNAQLDTELAKPKSEEVQLLEKEIPLYKQKVTDFMTLVEKRQNPVNALALVEDLTHKEVFFDDFSIDLLQGTTTLSGHTASFRKLEQQLLIFELRPESAIFTLSSLGMGSKEWPVDFSVDVAFNPQLFKLKEVPLTVR